MGELLAPFPLANLLMERMLEADTARVDTVAPNAQALGRIDFGDLQGEHSNAGPGIPAPSNVCRIPSCGPS
ncbi:hypothetical protein [Arthrobacter wenxiniae]|uniref:hypothetical protein n=1 Tax=Arthrobacter wenxiniae TaxID=2713570 RepID=UPI001C3FF71C|nr:hypothetical protein [Arthrobacter wenxiniae]